MNGSHLWTIGSLVLSGGRTVIDDWCVDQSAGVRAAFDTALKYLRDQPHANWVRPFIGTLRKECVGLVEVRFKTQGVQQRPIGFYGPGPRHHFTIVAFAIEKDGEFIPPNVCVTALKRKKLVINDPSLSAEYIF